MLFSREPPASAGRALAGGSRLNESFAQVPAHQLTAVAAVQQAIRQC
jgi:hypothetical protein